PSMQTATNSSNSTPPADNSNSSPPANGSGSTPPPNARRAGAPTGSITLTIAAGPTVANLLAAKTLVVLKDSLENVLAQAGVNAQGRSSRISAWSEACGTAAGAQICQAGLNGVRSYSVATTKLDANGSVRFPNIPTTGTFYVVTETLRPHQLLWNVR